MLVIFLVCALFASSPVSAIWPFPPKRFSKNALLSAGSLGVEGRVVAFGDFNGDQFLDVMTLGSDQRTLTVYLWNHEAFVFRSSASFQHHERVYNVVPGDFTHDGTLDVLIMSQNVISSQLSLTLYSAIPGGGFSAQPITTTSSSLSQPIPLDIDGDMKIDLLGSLPSDSSHLKVWQNVWNASDPSNMLYDIVDAPLYDAQCKLSNPHSNAIVDLNGDCLADIFLVCDDSSTQKSYQIWVNDKEKGFSLAQTGKLPGGTQSVTFADINRDGTVDMLITTCTSVSPSTGLGTGCVFNIAYNQQLPLCAPPQSVFFGKPVNGSSCRKPEALCAADPQFKFQFSGDSYVSIPVSDILSKTPSGRTPSLLVMDTTFSPSIPVPPRLGDMNLDGFPDLIFIAGTTQDRLRTVSIVLSERCGKGTVGCANGALYGWREVKKDVNVLAGINDARGVALLDIDEDGTLDLLVQRTGDQGEGNVMFIQNNFYYDAFFMKAILLNGACPSGSCTPSGSGAPYHPFGVSYSGASYKYTVLDTTGKRSAAQVPQLPQTAYQSLLTPYAFFGIGRTNNYIENLFAGSTKHTQEHFINLEMVIPNSKLVINPSPDNDAWRKELYLRPGEWIPWVGVSVVAAMVGFAGVAIILHLNEKREDEMERRRTSHHINFDAL
ncbi:hypothetical protein K488DRAFT_56617 [Vararia minispora EC-137]|uniref:Uncharacterized protein n=1 Tax=Vararia minispora EC-137 TaxID=1314806 RepID=A0ACB8QBW3_9AGAM|nr:hypothetical protein K488DRAFT_56617 [Vararia minispora EC-137]